MAVYTASYSIHTYEADVDGRATFASIFRYLQDIAAVHATEIGYGLEDLKEQASLWVLSRFLYRSRRTPRWRETLRIETWPTGTEGIFALRDWLVSDESGQEVALATSSWVVIDIEKRTPVRVERIAQRMDMIVDRRLFERNAGKVATFDRGQPSFGTRATFSDMDLNRHVNATRYVEWMFEGLPHGLREGGSELVEIEINFAGECRAGDEMVVHTQAMESAATTAASRPVGAEAPPEPTEFLQSVSKVSDGVVVCRSRSRWRAT